MKGPKKFLVLKNSGSQKLLSSKNCWAQKISGSERFWVPNIHIHGSQNFFDPDFFRPPKNFGPKKFLVAQNFGSQISFGSRKLVGPEKFFTRKFLKQSCVRIFFPWKMLGSENVRPEKFWVSKTLGLKKFCVLFRCFICKNC